MTSRTSQPPNVAQPDYSLHERACPVCDSRDARLLYAQRFEVPTQGGIHGGYDVVLCDRCGCAFAGATPSQQFFEWYYRALARKDEMLDPSSGCQETDETVKRNNHAADFIAPHMRSGARVLDVGCYTGYLLRRVAALVPDLVLTGLDPSSFAAGVAKQFHQLDVRVGTLFDATELGRFDCVIASHVVEHLVEVRPFLERVKQLMAADGLFFIEVPDAAGFSADPVRSGTRAEPFFEYNFEHINYFTMTSMRNLLEMHGFELVRIEARQSTLPVLAAVCRLRPLPYATESPIALASYQAESAQAHAQVSLRVDATLRVHPRVVVWGAGAHTQRLLASGALSTHRVEFFVDANPALIGGQLGGRPVHSPEVLRGIAPTAVLISSFRSELEIAERLRREWAQHAVILLYH